MTSHSLQALRDRAENLIEIQAVPPPADREGLSYEAMRRMVHELQVHQVELEMQNDELRKTQLELDAERARYFDLYDLAPVGYCTVSEPGLILEANFTAAVLLDLVRSDLVNKPVNRLIAQTDQDIYYQCRKALMETGAAQACELQMLKQGGTPFWVLMRLTAAQGATGAPVQRMVLTDISERKRQDDELQAQNHALAAARAVADKANQAKTDFLSNMTHELRSPLNAILGFAQLMDIGPPAPSSAQKTNIDQILRAGWYLLDLIGEILDLTSIEAGQLKLKLAPVPLFEVLRDSRASVAAAAQTKGIHIHVEQVSETLLVNADRARLLQIIVHLLSNAVKYNRTGGKLDVTCSIEAHRRLRLCVHDGGYGLSTDKIVHLFQPFNRLGRETSAEEGTGVGLALSKRLVELMGGTISAHSTVGVGSVFWIELDLSPSPADIADADVPTTSTGHGTRTNISQESQP
ncbi:MAG: PAS domain-containing sensor histidine kinase [Pseudomonadota bacterium]